MGVEQIGQRARTEFDEEDSKPSTSGSDNGSTSKENTRLFGEGLSCYPNPANQTTAHKQHDNHSGTPVQAEIGQNPAAHPLVVPARVQSEQQTLLVQTADPNRS